MSAPKPDEITRLIADIHDEIDHGFTVGEGRSVAQGGTFRTESWGQTYRWFHGAAHERRVGGGGSAQLCRVCNGTGYQRIAQPDAQAAWRRCEACTPRGVGDPTGEVTVTGLAPGALLSKLDEAGRHLRHALVAVRTARAAMEACETVIDRGVDRTLPNERAIPRTATKGEIDAARQAQARRAERGEGVA